MSEFSKPDGRKLDHALLEHMRFRAMELMDGGMSAAEVGRAFGVTRQAVSNWRKAYRENGPDALRAVPVPGRPPRIGRDISQEIGPLVVDHTPQDYGFPDELWTR